MGMQKGEGDHICSDDKRLVVFLTGMEKPPTFCHLSNGSRKFELGLQLYEGVHILTTVPWPQRLGTTAAWLPWPDTACWATTVSEHTWENRHIHKDSVQEYITATADIWNTVEVT